MDEIALIEIFRREKYRGKQNHFQLDKGKNRQSVKMQLKASASCREQELRERTGGKARSRGMRQGGGGEVSCHIYIMQCAIKSSKP
jgi:hypothetical protein